MTRDRRESSFWLSVGTRLLVIVLAGWLSILWFRGCLTSQIRDEIRYEQEKTAGDVPR